MIALVHTPPHGGLCAWFRRYLVCIHYLEGVDYWLYAGMNIPLM